MKEYLAREETNALRGLAALMVVAAHYVQRINMLDIAVSIPLVSKLGRYGVAIFFVCSGYGLMESYQRDKSLPGYWRKRLKTVFLPYWLIQALSLCFLPITDHISGRALIFQFTGIRHWYIVVCFFLYLIFYFTVKYCDKYLLVGILIGISLLNIILICIQVPDYWYMSNYTFLFGILLSVYKMEFANNRKGIQLIAAVVLFLTSSVAYAKLSHIWVIYFICKNLSAVFWTALVFLLIRYISVKNKLLQEIGGCSLFLYIIHLNVFDFIDFRNIDSFVIYTLGLCISVIAAFLLCRVYLYVLHRWEYGREEKRG